MDNTDMRIVALVQARMGSSRLPRKVMADISGHPAIWHIVNRLKNAPELTEIVVATSTRPENDPLVEFCSAKGISCFRGSEDDVLDRFYQAAKHYKADVIVRITADCPLIDPETVSLSIRMFVKASGALDYVSTATGAGAYNQKVNKYPDGTDVEVFPFRILEQAWCEATEAIDRGESVLSYVWRRKDKFRCRCIPCFADLGSLRWTVDRAEDLEFVRKVYERLYRPPYCFLMKDVLRLLEAEPSLRRINEGGVGKEGYEKYWQKAQR